MMTPQTLPIDRQFKGVGRIKRASGTVDPRMRRNYNRMLSAFYDQGRVDLLRAIRDGVLTFAEAYDAHRRHALHELVTGELAKPLHETWTDWLENERGEYSAKHIVSLRQSLKYLESAGAVRVADLPTILRDLRGTLGAKYPRTFNVTRAGALAFVRSTLTKAHPLWLQCSAVEMRKVTPKRKGVHLTPDQARNFFDPRGDDVDLIAWTMLTTGMHEKEFWGDWQVAHDRVRIHGEKRKGRVRDVPLLLSPMPPTMHPRTFTDKLRERTNHELQPYDLRRTYAHWLESAGIPRTRRKLYMGHGAADVTDLYERHEVAAFLLDDAAKLRAFVGLSPTISHPLRVVGNGRRGA